VRAQVLDVDVDKERISLGIKQLSGDPYAGAAQIKKGDVVTCTVSEVQENGIEVTIAGGAKAFIRRGELSRERSEQRPERFAVGDKVDAKVTNIDRSGRKLTLSIKAREIAEEKEAVAQYGSSDSGASLGDILGAALSRAQSGKEGGKDEGPAGSKKS
jgi:small subunit ribosomal protein S1